MKTKFKVAGIVYMLLLIYSMLNLTESKGQGAAPKAWYRQTHGYGVPKWTPSTTQPGTIAFACFDDSTGKNYVYNKSILSWEETQFGKPEKGDKGDQGIQGVQGVQGIPGTSNGTILFPFTFPEKFGATHLNQTFAQANKDQNYINANFPGIGATVNDPIDWAAWQMATNEAGLTGKSLWAYGDYYINDKEILFFHYFKSVTIAVHPAILT